MERRIRSPRKHSAQWIAYLLLAVVAATALFSSGAYSKYVTGYEFEATVRYDAALAEQFILEEHKALLQPDGTYRLSTAETVLEQTYPSSLIPRTYIPKDPYIKVTGKTEIDSYLYVEMVESEKLKELTTVKPMQISEQADTPEAGKYTYSIPASSAETPRRICMTLAAAEALAGPDGVKDWTAASGNKEYTFTLEKGETFSVVTSGRAAFTTVKRLDYAVDLTLWEELSGVTGPHGGKVYVYKKIDPTGKVINKANFTLIDGKPIPVLKDDRIGVVDKVPISGLGEEKLTFYGFLLQKTGTNTALQQWQAQ